MTTNKTKMPLFTTFKRDELSNKSKLLIRLGFGFSAVIVSIIIATLIIKENPFEILAVLFEGAVILPWRLILDTFILLGFGIAIVAPFKMRYWNMGANGQVMMAALISIVLMFYLGGKVSNFVLILLMFVSSLIVSVIWAVIPALFKTFFKTNETLFTLMMNYIATALVAYVNFAMAQGKQETIGIINFNTQYGWFPSIIDKYFLPAFIILVITVIMYVYIYKTKHGYEVSVLGDSAPTANYVGMNTKWITIRTLIISGLITGVMGFLYASAIDHSISTTTGGSLGFTGVLVAWLSNFNPITMGIISFLLAFLTLGTQEISSTYRLGSNNLSSIIISLIFFSILIAEFFIKYKVRINLKRHKEVK